MPQPPIDTVRRFETPEGVVLQLRAAGLPARAAAWLVDLLIRLGVGVAVMVPLAIFGEAGVGLFMMWMFALEWLYPVLGEVLLRGATPGKAAMGIAVVHDDGTPISWTSSMLRNLLRAADFLPGGYIVGIAAMLGDRDFRRLGDMVAGTVVIYRERPRVVDSLPEAPLVPVETNLDRAEQWAIEEFAARSSTWSDERREELADVLGGWVGARGPRAVVRLHGMARWLRGER